MKIIYCNHSIYNPGGMERVMLNKIKYLVEQLKWEVVIVTTDQKDRPSFYPLPEGVRTIDLDINYSDDNAKNTFLKIVGYLRRRKLHKERLAKVLALEKPDVLVSLFPSESSFFPDLKDGSKKVLELHFNKFFRLQYGRTGLYGLINRWRTHQDEKLVSRFDAFVVLTQEDAGYWGKMPNLHVIPNAAIVPLTVEGETVGANEKGEDTYEKRVIAVGRLDYQKGFDRLITAWNYVMKDSSLSDWKLDIYGQGEWKDMLNAQIKEFSLQDCVTIHEPTKNIHVAYEKSGLMVMSSHYEGFPMVMIEGMSHGLPVVSFDFKCGPKDIIQNGKNGIIVKDGDIMALADAMKRVMKDDEMRNMMSEEARKVTKTNSEECVMKMWIDLFNKLVQR